MTDFPLPTLAPTIDANGITAPAFADILQSIIVQVQSIYGSDLFLDPSSQDYQFLSILSLAQQQSNDAVISAYLAYAPTTAQGTGLSSVVKINGLRRLTPSNSQAVLTITGIAGTVIAISNGAVLVGDNQGLGTQWQVPAVTIPVSGTIDVTASCVTQGAVAAATATLVNILTPIPGWQTVTNAAAAVPGQPVETDFTLRQRQSISTSLPAITPLDAILAAVKNIQGVGRATAYQNDTNTTDANGIPAHSISVVVEGGAVSTIATTIAAKKPPGTGTYGTTSLVVIDEFGIPNTINYFALASIELFVIITIAPLTGFISPTGTTLVAAVVAYLSALSIGEDSFLNRLWSPVNLNGDAATESSGQTQTALDALSATYNPTSILQARGDMTVTGGPYNPGATTISVARVLELFVGATIAFEMDNLTTFPAVITGIAGNAVTFTGGVPAGRTVQNGAFCYVAGDLQVAFNEAALCTPTNITLIVS